MPWGGARKCRGAGALACIRAKHAFARAVGLRLADPPLDLPLEQRAQEAEVAPDDALEARGRPPEHVAHGVAQRCRPQVVVVLAGALLASGRALFLGVAWLVEVGLRHHDDALDRDEHLRGGGEAGHVSVHQRPCSATVVVVWVSKAAEGSAVGLRACRMVEPELPAVGGIQPSPCHVPSRLRQTLPSE